MPDVTLQSVRQQYPQYSDLSDDQLAQGLHQKFYSDMPFDQFSQKIGYVPASAAPKDYDPVPPSGKVPDGFYAVTGDDGKQTLRHNVPIFSEENLADISQALSDLPGVGAAERMVQGGARLAGKAASGIAGATAGLFGGDAAGTTQKVQSAVNQATELPPSNDPVVQGMQGLQEGTQNFLNETGLQKAHDTAVGNLPPLIRGNVETAEEALPDIAALVGIPGARALAPEQVTAQEIARSSGEVGKAVGYTGLKTRMDLRAPGNQAITDALISKDAGMVPGQPPSVAALQNAIKVGPGKVYRAAEEAIPEKLTQDPELQADLGNLPDQTSQLPRSPDVDALQETMLAKPDFTRDELFANIREARERAKAHWKSDDPDKAALGDAYHSLANAYEEFAGRRLDEAEDSDVSLDDWKAARTQMAKNYQAQGALRGEHFDPAVYARTAEKNPGLLTGNAAIVGHVANGLPPGAAAGFDFSGAALGAGAGELAGHAAGIPGVGGMAGAVAGPLIRAKLEQLRTRGNPDLAAAADTNPALSYFRRGEPMPTGWNLAPSSPLPSPPLRLPSPSMVNAGGGASTANTLTSLGLTPDVQAAAAQHPAVARLAALRAQLAQPPERPAAPVDFQGPQKWGDFSIAPPSAVNSRQAPPATPSASSGSSLEGIPFENVLERAGTQRPPVGAPAVTYRPPAKSPNQPNVRTPPGAPEVATAPPPGPSPAQLAFRNKLAADRLRKVAGDLRLEGPGGATGSPLDRVRAALARQDRGYAGGGSVRGASPVEQAIQSWDQQQAAQRLSQLQQQLQQSGAQ